MEEINRLKEAIIGAAIEVHRHLGPGLSEAAYERAVCMELAAAGMAFERQLAVPVVYKGEIIAEYRPDLVIAGRVIVEVKSIDRIAPVHVAQMLSTCGSPAVRSAS